MMLTHRHGYCIEYIVVFDNGEDEEVIGQLNILSTKTSITEEDVKKFFEENKEEIFTEKLVSLEIIDIIEMGPTFFCDLK